MLAPYQIYDLKIFSLIQKVAFWEFPCGPVVRTLRFHCQGLGSMPSWGTKILYAMWYGQIKKNKGLPFRFADGLLCCAEAF